MATALTDEPRVLGVGPLHRRLGEDVALDGLTDVLHPFDVDRGRASCIKR